MQAVHIPLQAEVTGLIQVEGIDAVAKKSGQEVVISFLQFLEIIMMRRRMVGRSIARAAVGTAVIAGTAGAVHHAQDQHWANQQAQQQSQYDQAYQQGAADA